MSSYFHVKLAPINKTDGHTYIDKCILYKQSSETQVQTLYSSYKYVPVSGNEPETDSFIVGVTNNLVTRLWFHLCQEITNEFMHLLATLRIRHFVYGIFPITRSERLSRSPGFRLMNKYSKLITSFK